ncbi:MAG: 23S rRNA (adenine(1618)-N(6))-methyltransferase, partial [Spirochaetaceae bacterium 4572_7]
MSSKKRSGLHKDNPHNGRYNFSELIDVSSDLEQYLKDNPKGDRTIDFGDSSAVLSLNRALLKKYYGVDHWDIPQGFLCPPIPGRADYIHYISEFTKGLDDVNVLDIGTGANLIYPIIGSQTFNWKFRASDIDPDSISNAQKIVDANPCLQDKIELVLQENKSYIFKDVIKNDDYFDLTICNPPFHGSLKEAEDSNRKKIDNLNKHKDTPIKSSLNFGGQKAELWCPGGEMFFLKKMIKESRNHADQVGWFSSLVSKSENVLPLKRLMRRAGAKSVKIIEMNQGNKISRILAWTF